jgi:hypothetical protein
MSRRLCLIGNGPVVLFDGANGGDTGRGGEWRHSGEIQYTSSISMDEDNIIATHVRNDNAINYHLMYTEKKFDMSRYKKLHVIAKRNMTGNYVLTRFGGVNGLGEYPWFQEVFGENIPAVTSYTETVIDLSGITAVCSIGILQPGDYNIGDTRRTYIRKLWLE